MKMKMMKINGIFLFFLGGYCLMEINQRIEEGRVCKYDLDQERFSKMDNKELDDIIRNIESKNIAERISMKLIEETANEWCSDSLDLAWDEVSDLEKDCKSQVNMSIVSDIWEDYRHSRIKDCESRDPKIEKDYVDCLGPAGESETVHHAIEAMMIYQQSKAIEEGM